MGSGRVAAIAALAQCVACGAASPAPAHARAEQQQECRAGQTRPADPCNECTCRSGRWQCSHERCEACPPTSSTRSGWATNRSGTLCCAATELPPGWRRATQDGCYDRLAPGLRRRPRRYLLIDREAVLVPGVHFKRGSAKVENAEAARLDAFLEKLRMKWTDSILQQPTSVRIIAPKSEQALARRRASAVKKLMVGEGWPPERVQLQLHSGTPGPAYVDRVLVSVELGPPPATGGEPTCTPGATLSSQFRTEAPRVRLTVCKNDVCVHTRVALGRLSRLGKSSMIFRLPPPLSGGVRIDHRRGGYFVLGGRVNAPADKLVDGDRYSVTVAPLPGGEASKSVATAHYGVFNSNTRSCRDFVQKH